MNNNVMTINGPKTIHIYAHTCMHTYIYVYICRYVHINVYICIYMYINVNVPHAHMCTHASAKSYSMALVRGLGTHTQILPHVRMWTDMRACGHTCMWTHAVRV